MKKVTAPQVATSEGATKKELPESVQAALGDLAGAAKEGLLALSVGVGLGVMHELMEAEVTEVVGTKGRHDPERSAVRHGHEDGRVTPAPATPLLPVRACRRVRIGRLLRTICAHLGLAQAQTQGSRFAWRIRTPRARDRHGGISACILTP
jgi:hypothetical protein